MVVYKETDTGERKRERARERDREREREGEREIGWAETGQRQSWTKRGRYMTVCLGSYQRKHRSPYGHSWGESTGDW